MLHSTFLNVDVGAKGVNETTYNQTDEQTAFTQLAHARYERNVQFDSTRRLFTVVVKQTNWPSAIGRNFICAHFVLVQLQVHH